MGKQKEEGRKEARRKRKKKPKVKRIMEVKKVEKEWEIWDEEETKGLVLERFHKWIHIFGKKASEKMPTRKLWNHAIETKKVFVLKKGKVYLLSREKREEMCKFIIEQLRKRYIRPSKLP